MCGNDAGNIYYKRQNVQALTEAGKPTMVAQEPEWTQGHIDPEYMGVLTF